MLLAWILVLAVAGPATAALWSALTERPRRARALAIASAVALAASVAIGRDDLGLQKLVSALIMPVGLWWVLSFGVAVWSLARAPRSLGRATMGLWIALTVLANGWLSGFVLDWLESQVVERPLPAEPLDAIVVPGGGAAFARDGSPQLTDYGDRVVLAARMYRAGRAKVLVATGSSITSISQPQDLTMATRVLWRDLGVPDEAIIGLAEPKNTSQEMAAVKALVARERWTRVGMLGSAHHLPRILALCAREGLDVYPIAADKRGWDPMFHPLFAVPSANGLRGISMVAWEVIGRAVGR